jgi:hypothetical protein
MLREPPGSPPLEEEVAGRASQSFPFLLNLSTFVGHFELGQGQNAQVELNKGTDDVGPGGGAAVSSDDPAACAARTARHVTASWHAAAAAAAASSAGAAPGAARDPKMTFKGPLVLNAGLKRAPKAGAYKLHSSTSQLKLSHV